MFELILYPDRILREQCKPVVSFDEEVKSWSKFLGQYMKQLNGYGLSAPQLGLNRRIFTIQLGDGVFVYVNPVIIEYSEETDVEREGCLSIPGIEVPVERPYGIKFTAQKLNGEQFENEFFGKEARIFQHEYDHLNGELIIDKISRAQKFLIKNKLKKLKKRKKKRQKQLNERLKRQVEEGLES